MTRKRQMMLDILSREKLPLNVSQVYEKAECAFDLATLYRGLKYLEEQQYISSFLFECRERGVERYYVAETGSHAHYFHCQSCHRFIPLLGCPVKESFSEIEKELGCQIQEHRLTLRGICYRCT